MINLIFLSRAGVGNLWLTGWSLSFKNSFIGTQPHSFFYVLSITASDMTELNSCYKNHVAQQSLKYLPFGPQKLPDPEESKSYSSLIPTSPVPRTYCWLKEPEGPRSPPLSPLLGGSFHQSRARPGLGQFPSDVCRVSGVPKTKALEEIHQDSEFSSPRSVQGDQAISSPLPLSFRRGQGAD